MSRRASGTDRPGAPALARPLAVVSRRRLLATSSLLVVAGLTGCTGDHGGPQSRRPSSDQLARDQMVAEKSMLLAAYAATAKRHQSLERFLAGFTEHVEAHLDALRNALPATPSTGSTPNSTGPPVATPAVPAERRAALRALADAEEAPAKSRTALVEAAGSGGFAALVASIAGCELAHAALLGAEAAR